MPYDHASAVDPGDADAWNNRATVLRALGRDPEAQEAERRASELGAQPT
ncbi:MAG TPA: tetratricopeptide repeat protein [Ktedonobacterales bacterium]